jgi:hypothetical protein
MHFPRKDILSEVNGAKRHAEVAGRESLGEDDNHQTSTAGFHSSFFILQSSIINCDQARALS